MKRLFIALIIIITSFYLNCIEISAESFKWPSDGWVYWKYKTDTKNADGTTCSQCHNGVDIWSTLDGGWNNDISGSSNSVYAAYPGVIVWDGAKGFIVKHNDNLYSNYYHLRNRQVGVGSSVNENTLIAYQDMDVTVHLHVTVSETSSGSGHIDPSPYFAMQLDATKPGAVPDGTYIARSDCGGVSITKSDWIVNGPLDCKAQNSFTIIPDSKISSLSGSVRIYIN